MEHLGRGFEQSRTNGVGRLAGFRTVGWSNAGKGRVQGQGHITIGLLPTAETPLFIAVVLAETWLVSEGSRLAIVPLNRSGVVIDLAVK